MTLPPQAVLVHRRTELDELTDRHGTRAQAAFFLSTRGRRIEDAERRHQAVKSAIVAVSAAVPADWRRAIVERADLPRWRFDPGDVVLAVGQDGLVANLARYVDGQPVIGINPEPGRNPGVLVPHPPGSAASLLAAVTAARCQRVIDELAMVEAVADDGQRLVSLNEVYVGQPTHQTAWYMLATPDGTAERQASSGLIVCTGTGATGWGRSAWLERHSAIELPGPAERRLAWFVREAWPSPASGTGQTDGALLPGESISLSVESDRLVAFGDGIESDAISIAWGQRVRIGLAGRVLRLVR
jgi:NAD kinase